MRLRHWPAYGLRLRTPRLELRLPTLLELDHLAELAAAGVREDGFLPFAWAALPPLERARNVMQWHWNTLADWKPENWTLAFTAFLDGDVIGSQLIRAHEFAVTKQVGSGCWLGSRYQRRGYGTEMLSAVLALAFDGLGAHSALARVLADNAASLSMFRKLGYQPNGTRHTVVVGELRREEHFLLDQPRWQRCKPFTTEITGLQPCLELFGLKSESGITGVAQS